MKLILLLCSGLLISFISAAQRVQLNAKTSFDMPANSQKITDLNLKAIAKEKKIKINEFPSSENKSIFISNDVVITFFASEKSEKMDLVKLKKSFESMAEGQHTFKMRLLSQDGKKCLIMENPLRSNIRIFAVNELGNGEVSVLLEFNEENRAKANGLLNSVIKGIVFKE